MLQDKAEEMVKIVDWNKIFMGLAVAIVFVMQQFHSMQLADVKGIVVPREEYERKHETVMHKDEILAALTALSARLNAMEEDK